MPLKYLDKGLRFHLSYKTQQISLVSLSPLYSNEVNTQIYQEGLPIHAGSILSYIMIGKFTDVILSQRSEDCTSSISDNNNYGQHEKPKKTKLPVAKNKLFKYIKPLFLYFIQKYVFIAIGSILTLVILYGIDQIIKLIGIDFPASVCLMLIVFFMLSFVSWLKDEAYTERYLLRYIDIPFGFNLRWMNLYFTPPFVTLVLADKVSVKEAFIIAAVFVVGYIFGFAFVGYFVWALQILLGTYDHQKATEENADVEKNQQAAHSEEQEQIVTARSPSTATEQDSSSSAHEPASFDGQEVSSSMGIRRTLTRVLSENDEDGEQFDEGLALSRMTTRNAEVSNAVAREANTDSEVIEKMTQRFDFILYTIIFVAGLPVYFCTGYELLAQLSVAILLFKACLLPPSKVKKYLHPILVSFSLSLLVFYILSLIKKQDFKVSIQNYKTGRTYLNLFNSSKYTTWPGAGDFLLSMMDISIAALSLAMYRYRKDLKRYFFALMPVVTAFSFMSFFIYPPVCYHLGISPSRSLGFTGRSVTMALGTPLVHAIGGSNQLMAVTTIMSGIIGVFLGDWISFTLLRIRRTDFVSRGVTLGVNCGAVSTAHLLSVDPRAAAMSSLSFTLFGTIMVILAAITPLVKIIRSLVGW